MAMAMAVATAMAVIRPEHAEGGWIHESVFFLEIIVLELLRSFLCLLDLTKRIRRLKILRQKIVFGGPESFNSTISWQICDSTLPRTLLHICFGSFFGMLQKECKNCHQPTFPPIYPFAKHQKF